MFPLIYLMNQMDFTNEQNVLMVRVGYAVVTVVGLLVWWYIWTQVKNTKNLQKIKVPKPAVGFGTPSTEFDEMTISEYDADQVMKALKQLGTGVLIIIAIHYQWNIVQPLFMQLFLGPTQLYKSPLFKMYVLGQKGEVEKRPFVEESPFAALMPPTPEAEAAVEEEKEEEEEPKAITEKKTTTEKKKRTKKAD